MKFKYMNSKFDYEKRIKLNKISPIKKIVILSMLTSLSLSGCNVPKIINDTIFETTVEKDSEVSSDNKQSNIEELTCVDDEEISSEIKEEKTTFEIVEGIKNNEIYNEYAVPYQKKQIVSENKVINEEQADQKEKKLVSITFDDGPSKYTSELVDILTDNDVKATFFIVGRNIENYQDSVVKAYQAGNEIGIHTYSHTSFTKMTIEEIKSELEQTENLLNNIDVDYSNIVRPPYGSINKEIQSSIDTSFILWSVDTRDWESRDKDSIIAEVKANIAEGSIILFHDVYPSTVAAIKELLPELTDEYEFVTVSELFEQNDKTLEENQKYYKIKK